MKFEEEMELLAQGYKVGYADGLDDGIEIGKVEQREQQEQGNKK